MKRSKHDVPVEVLINLENAQKSMSDTAIRLSQKLGRPVQDALQSGTSIADVEAALELLLVIMDMERQLIEAERKQGVK